MKVYSPMKLSDHTYTRVERGVKYIWDIPVLLSFVKEQGYKPFDLPLDGIDLSSLMWRMDNTQEFITHVKRVNECDDSHPILIDDLGVICDGWHRVVKAIIKGKHTIKAIRLNEMPGASCTEDV